MVVAAALFTFVTILWVYFLWSRRKYYAFALKMPGPIGLPFIGIVHRIFNMEDMLYELPNIASQYKVKTYFSWLGPYPLIYTMDPKIAEIILNSPDCNNKSLIYDVLNDVLGVGILTSKSPIWNEHRKLLNPCFSHKVLLDFFPNFNKLARELCDKFDANVDSGEVNIKEFVFDLALKSSVASTIGLEFDQGSNIKFLEYVERLLKYTVNRALKPWLRSNAIFSRTSMYKPFLEARNFVMDFIYELVVNKIKLLEKYGLEGNNNKEDPTEESIGIEKTKHIFIDQAIRIYQRNDFTFHDVVSEANLMVFAAFETSATALYTALMCLAMHPQYQDKVFEEILSVFPEKDLDVSNENFKDLVYLDMCINESLRVTATVPLIARECSNDLRISEDIVIPKGTQIIIGIIHIHTAEDEWGPDAKTYNPDHFLPANLVDKHKYSFMPFSKGPRNCIGWQYARMVLKVSLAQALRKYRFTTKFKFEDLRFVEHITMKYENLPFLEIQRR